MTSIGAVPTTLVGTAILAATACGPLTAQTVRGTVLDSATSKPLDAAFVELLLSDNQVVARVSGDDRGQFLVRAPAAGSYRVRLHRIGYQSLVSSPALVHSGRETTLIFRLSAVAVPLAPVAVTAAEAEPYLMTSGYYVRKRTEIGHFLDPPVVEKLASKAKLGTDILVHIPGVSIVQRERGIPIPQLRTCRGRFSRPRAWDPLADTTGLPRIYLDGIETEREALALLTPTDILAVEVYMGPAQIPLLYGGTNTPCGVILVWTKH